MYSQNPSAPFYPEVIQSNPELASANPNYYPSSSSSSSNLYPKIDIVDDLFIPNLNHPGNHLPPDYSYSPSAPPYEEKSSPTAPPVSTEEVLVRIPGAILHLIDKEYSVELACGDLEVMVLQQDRKIVAVLARVADEVQWPLTKDGAAVKVDESHYFFSMKTLAESDSSDEDEKGAKKSSLDQDDLISYGLTIASKGQEGLLRQLDSILEKYCSFSVHTVSKKGKKGKVLDPTLARDTSPAELVSGNKKEIVEQSTAYWTTLAPNVEDYSGTAAKLIAAGSGQLIRGILWCGDVTVESLKRGNDILMRKMDPKENVEVNPKTMRRIKRAKKMTRMTEKVATGVLSGVLRVSGYVTSSVANTSAGKKFFSMIPGEILLASLDGFNKVCDAFELSGKNVMSTSSTVTTGLVSHRYGEEAGKATDEGFKTAGHAIGTAWAVFKLRKALNPKSSLKATALAKTAVKAAAAEAKTKAKAKSKKSSK